MGFNKLDKIKRLLVKVKNGDKIANELMSYLVDNKFVSKVKSNKKVFIVPDGVGIVNFKSKMSMKRNNVEFEFIDDFYYKLTSKGEKYVSGKGNDGDEA